MASGSFNLSRTGSTSSYITFKCNWSSTPNTSGNYSTVNVNVVASKSSSSTAKTYGTQNTSATVNGSTQSNSGSFTLEPGTSITLLSKSFTVYHNSDGKKTIPISISVGGNAMWGSGSANVTLDTIPRNASITAAPNFTDEENPTINYSNPAGNAITTLKACIANSSGTVVYAAYRDIPKDGSSYTFELTDEERDALRLATINSNTLAVKFYVTSVIGGVEAYSTLDKILTIVNAMPDLTAIAKDTGGYSVPLTGDENKIIKGFNYVNVSMDSTAKKGSTIKSQTITNGSQMIKDSSGGFTDTEDNDFIFSVTDSRGNTTIKTITLDMVDYIKLTCNLETKNPTADGEMAFKVSGNYFNGNFGAVDNTLAVEFRYKENDGEYSEWVAAEPTPTISGNSYETNVNLTGLNYRSSYTFQARAIDKTNIMLSSEKKVKTIPVYDWGENDFQFNVDIYDKFNQLINNGLAEYDGGNIDVNETLSSLCLAQYNTPNNSLYYVMTFFYGTKSLTANRTQIAIPYIYDVSQKKSIIFVRQYVNGQWTEWRTQDSYSTSEQMIGTWVDGKPLYRKTIQKTVAANATLNFNLTDLGINNADVIFIDVGNSTAHYNTPVGGAYSSINFYSGTNDYGNVYVNYDRQLVIKNNSGSNRDMYITLKYTKTTD